MNVKYTARFTPEAWVRDEAIEVDPLGPQEWDCTEYAQQNQEYLPWLEKYNLDPPGVIDNDDVFKDDPAAPQWVRDWRGPFTIRIVRTPGERHPDAYEHGEPWGPDNPAPGSPWGRRG